ncbi:MAG TPA: alanine--tRNA ligase [Thermoplasmata archaeon]|nr:alanine--tRNA ligase [Thermoplasmata archaeon]
MPSDYEVELFRTQGFRRQQCPKCSTWFWSLREPGTCGETPCVEYSFIGDSPAKKRLTFKAMREEFLSFLEGRGHTRVRRYPVVARWREDVFFTQASIYPFQPWVINGDAEPPANPLAISQPCVRFNDIDNVGKTGRHLTLFEMMAHHAFNRPGKEVYWTDRTAELCQEFFTSRLGVPAEGITYKESLWEGGGNSGPCLEVICAGLEVATLVFMQNRDTPQGRVPMETKVVDTGYGLERITWLSQGTPSAYEAVFGDTLTYIRRAAGLQRTEDRVLQEYSRVAGLVDVESLSDLRSIREIAAKRLGMAVDDLTAAVRPFEHLYAVVDHCRSLMFLLADGVVPSNVKEGYFARLLVRRAMRALRALDLNMKLGDPITFMIDQYKEDFPELLENRSDILKLVDIESKRYEETLSRGRDLVRKTEEELKVRGETAIAVDALVELYDSQGLTPDLVQEFATVAVTVPDDFYARVAARHEAGKAEAAVGTTRLGLPATRLRVYEDPDKRAFRAKVLAVQEDAVVLDQTFFYPEGGGQESDHGHIGGYRVHDVQKVGDSVLHFLKEASKLAVGKTVKCEIDWDRRRHLTRHHTATHIVLGAARRVLGNHVWQTGAHKGADSARLDITHYEGLTDEQLQRIEDEANAVVLLGEEVSVEVLSRDKAEASCGFRLYQGGSVPGGQLRVVRIPHWDCEACGGTHCHNTAEVGLIKILRSKRIQDGVVRLEYTAGHAAHRHVKHLAATVDNLASKLRVPPEEIASAVDRLVAELEDHRKTATKAAKAETSSSVRGLLEAAEEVSGVRVVVHFVDGGPKELSALAKELLAGGKVLAILGGKGPTAFLAVGRSPDVPVSCPELLAAGAGLIGGKGGGKADYAQGGGPNVAGIEGALQAIRAAAVAKLAGKS